MSLRTFTIGALVALTIQSILLGSIVYTRYDTLKNGTEVTLKSTMVDPRDLFRGHYVRLNLTAGNLSKDSVQIFGSLKVREDVFVELKKADDGFWVGTNLHAELPDSSKTVVIKGKLRQMPRSSSAFYRIDFPFDRFFAPLKRAKELEKTRNKGKLGVVLALDGKGNGYIKGISVDGEIIYNEPLL